MDILIDMLVQDAVYWEPSDPGESGRVGFEDPIQIKCRWEDIAEEFLDAGGNKALSKARVYVDRDLDKLGALRQGTLGEVDDEANPFANTKTFEIRRFEKLPTLDGDEFLRTAYL